MRLAIIDSRKNQIVSSQKLGSDPLPSGSYEQYIIDLDQLPNNLLVPAWIISVDPNGHFLPFPGILGLERKKRIDVHEVRADWQSWCEAGLTLAIGQFGKALEQDRSEAIARIKYWIEGGSRHVKGWIKEKIENDDLPMRILQQWHYWQSDAFQLYIKHGKLTLWGARRETIKNAGYQLALTGKRLEVTYGRMGFKGELRKIKKR